MTYHRNDNRLRCHYCGWSVIPPQSCPECGSIDIGSSGFGTEYIEAETKAKFPNARIIRLDTDVVKKKEDLLVKEFNDYYNYINKEDIKKHKLKKDEITWNIFKENQDKVNKETTKIINEYLLNIENMKEVFESEFKGKIPNYEELE